MFFMMSIPHTDESFPRLLVPTRCTTRMTVSDCRARNVTPHVARNDARTGGSAIDDRTSRHAGYRASQVIRKRIEEQFGWGKTVCRIRQTVYRGIQRVDQHFKLTWLRATSYA
jgi:hypothetical protein